MTEVRNNVEENKSPADRHVALVCDMNTYRKQMCQPVSLAFVDKCVTTNCKPDRCARCGVMTI